MDDEDGHGFTPPERAALYWKKAANAYKQACSAQSPEAKKLYMQIAMAWATLADEMERQSVPIRQAPDHHAKPQGLGTGPHPADQRSLRRHT